MKPVLNSITKTAGRLLAVAFLLVSALATAQPHYRSVHEPGKSYWKIQTDYATRNTVIRFYNAQNEAIYQETLLGKYVKLNRRNIRLFDEMLSRVVNSQLLASQVKSYDLMASNVAGFVHYKAVNHLEEESTLVSISENRSFVANTLVNEAGKLRVNFSNPNQKKVLIELTDETARTVYYNESSHLAGYNRYFNITHLLSGKYRLQVNSPEQKLAYWLTVDKPNRQYELIPVK
ncbi:hypothetical protein [Larkinella ripae]